jgi:hypothetical protein
MRGFLLLKQLLKHSNPSVQNNELIATDKKLTQAQAIMMTTRVMGSAVLLNKCMTFST